MPWSFRVVPADTTPNAPNKMPNSAQKRGGGQVFVSLEATAGEEGYLLEPVDELSPDQVLRCAHSEA